MQSFYYWLNVLVYIIREGTILRLYKKELHEAKSRENE